MKLRSGAPQKLYETRERLGLSRKDVERMTDKAGHKVSEATIFNIENGGSKAPYPRNIFALCNAYGIDAAEVMEMGEARTA